MHLGKFTEVPRCETIFHFSPAAYEILLSTLSGGCQGGCHWSSRTSSRGTPLYTSVICCSRMRIQPFGNGLLPGFPRRNI